MSSFGSLESLPHIPDDLTVPQFILDYPHTTRPIRKHGSPWLIEDTTGKEIGFEEASGNLQANYSRLTNAYYSFVDAHSA
jgi:hypothetical protein